MNRGVAVAYSLYLELRTLGLEIWVEENAWRNGGVLDFGIALGGLESLSVAEAFSVTGRVLDNENDLVRIVVDTQDPDIYAIRREGEYG